MPRIQSEVRETAVVAAACSRLGLPGPMSMKAEVLSDSPTRVAIQLPGWRYPAVCNVDSGHIDYDNRDGDCGDQLELYRFLQAYTVEKAKIKMHQLGYSFTERERENGSIRLTFWMVDDDE